MTEKTQKRLYDLLVSHGYSPFKLIKLPIFIQMAQEYGSGGYDDADMIRALDNLNIFRGGRLKAKVEPGMYEHFRLPAN